MIEILAIKNYLIEPPGQLIGTSLFMYAEEDYFPDMSNLRIMSFQVVYIIIGYCVPFLRTLVTKKWQKRGLVFYVCRDSWAKLHFNVLG